MTDECRIINRLSAIGVLGNIFLSAFKFAAGFLANSGAMVADAVHSLSDVIATAIAYVGTKLGRTCADDDHPYGHERIETLASLILGAILIVTAVSIGCSAVKDIISGEYDGLSDNATVALVAAIVSIVVKEAMFWYTMHYAKVLKSDAFKADAWHHRADAISSVAALIGIGCAMAGYPIMEPIATAAIGLLILKISIEIISDSVKKILDTSCDPEIQKDIRGCAEKIDGVIRVDVLRTRLFGNKIYVDMEIAVDGSVTVREGHRIAENVHDAIESAFEDIKHVMVHVNPDGSD